MPAAVASLALFDVVIIIVVTPDSLSLGDPQPYRKNESALFRRERPQWVNAEDPSMSAHARFATLN